MAKGMDLVEILQYETATLLAGAWVMLLLQGIFGLLLLWTLWAMAFTLVVMSYIDHVCVGWKNAEPITQTLRVITCLLLGGCCVLILYLTIPLILGMFIPGNIDPQDLTSILISVQIVVGRYRTWGALIYFYLWTLTFATILSLFRAIVHLLNTFVSPLVLSVLYSEEERNKLD